MSTGEKKTWQPRSWKKVVQGVLGHVLGMLLDCLWVRSNRPALDGPSAGFQAEGTQRSIRRTPVARVTMATDKTWR